jgi:predicted metal-dependent hydrolase
MSLLRTRHGSINHDGHLIEFEIVHRAAVTRRIHLEINERGGLQVVAPRRMSVRDINLALQQRAHRVTSFLAEARAHKRDLPALNYRNGERHLFLGESYPLNITERSGKRGMVRLDGDGFKVVAPGQGPENVRNLLIRWYRRQAQQQFESRLASFAGLAPWTDGELPAMRLRLMKRTWGSCSSKGIITLNPHLVKAPADCIDYVIAHEICHLREHNHGRAFYALQEQLFPDWRDFKAHLKQKGHIYLHT